MTNQTDPVLPEKACYIIYDDPLTILGLWALMVLKRFPGRNVLSLWFCSPTFNFSFALGAHQVVWAHPVLLFGRPLTLASILHNICYSQVAKITI